VIKILDEDYREPAPAAKARKYMVHSRGPVAKALPISPRLASFGHARAVPTAVVPQQPTGENNRSTPYRQHEYS